VGTQTQRSLEHFNIGKDLIPREMIAAYATLKKAAANANHAGGRLDDQRHKVIVQVCDEILGGQHQDMFPLHVWARPSTTDLYSFVDEFVEAVQEVFPKCCIHFEDWTGVDAMHLLQRYRDKYCVYNDDVQGTAGITLAGMINAAKLKGTNLKDEKYLFLGAGSAGIGLANLLCSALVAQGLTLKDAQSRVYMFDINGLLESTRKDLVDFQKLCRGLTSAL
jgi:malic enzyme